MEVFQNSFNLTRLPWCNFGKRNVVIKRRNGSLILKNDSTEHQIIVAGYVKRIRKSFLNISFKGKTLEGAGCLLLCFNRFKHKFIEAPLNSENSSTDPLTSFFMVGIKIKPHTTVVIDEVKIAKTKKEVPLYKKFLKRNKVLVISPSYPAPDNIYFSGFIHSRVKAYKEQGADIDVACIFDYLHTSFYTFEGVDVYRAKFSKLREVLLHKHYDKILLHFFDERFFDVLNQLPLHKTEIMLFCHGPETLYWDSSQFLTPYYAEPVKLSQEMINDFKIKDECVRSITSWPNVKWIFVSKWLHYRSEELTKITFPNYEIIPNNINENIFKYTEKKPNQRFKLFMLRRYDDINKYAVDVSVAAILELTKKPYFDSLEINVYGEGNAYDKLFAPLRKFKNIKFYKNFLTHEQIAEVHRNHGIGLFPTRHDTQGVSSCEAALSGVVTLSSNFEAVKEYLLDECLTSIGDAVAFARKIDEIIMDSGKFLRLSRESHEKVLATSGLKVTTDLEYKLISKAKVIEAVEPGENLLSVVIPAYNAERFLARSIDSLIKANCLQNMEVIVINDGSTDDTKKVAETYLALNKASMRPVYRVVNQENSGHGMALYIGIQAATGRYVRCLDSDDWFNSDELQKLVELLKNTNADVVVTDFAKVAFESPQNVSQKYYTLFESGKVYYADDFLDPEKLGDWGPILATSCYRTKMLQNLNFSLPKKCFYADMVYNAYSILHAKSIVYYDLDIYRYLVGSSEQSISAESMQLNSDDHEKIIFKLFKIINRKDCTQIKSHYIEKKLLIPMINTQYYIVSVFCCSPHKFRVFDRLLPYEYKCQYKSSRFCRMTQGFGVYLIPLIRKVKNIFRRV